MDTSALTCCFYAFDLQILEYCFPMWGHLLNVTFSFLSARCIRWPVFVPIRVSCRCVIDVVWLGLVCSTRLIRTLTTVSSEGFDLLPLEFDIPELRPQLIHWSFEVSRCRTCQFVRSSLPPQVRMWNDLPYTVFDTGTLDEFTGAVNRWLLP